MTHSRHLRTALVLCGLIFGACLAGAPRVRAQQPAALAAAQVVKTHTYISLDRVPRGKEFQAAVVVQIAQGYHMNSHKPLDSYLIPTTLTPQLPAGFKLVEAIYPAGHDRKFPFSPDKPLNVYTDSVTLRLRLVAEAKAPLGSTSIPVTLRYQACNNSACLPPVKVPVPVQVQVASAGSAGRPAHADIFRTSAEKK